MFKRVICCTTAALEIPLTEPNKLAALRPRASVWVTILPLAILPITEVLPDTFVWAEPFPKFVVPLPELCV